MKLAHFLVLAISGHLTVATPVVSDGTAQPGDIYTSTYSTQALPDRRRTRTGKIWRPMPATPTPIHMPTRHIPPGTATPADVDNHAFIARQGPPFDREKDLEEWQKRVLGSGQVPVPGGKRPKCVMGIPIRTDPYGNLYPPYNPYRPDGNPYEGPHEDCIQTYVAYPTPTPSSASFPWVPQPAVDTLSGWQGQKGSTAGHQTPRTYTGLVTQCTTITTTSTHWLDTRANRTPVPAAPAAQHAVEGAITADPQVTGI